jgi:hypothetical protein
MSFPTPQRVWLCEPRLHFTTIPSKFCLQCGKPMVAFVVEPLEDDD